MTQRGAETVYLQMTDGSHDSDFSRFLSTMLEGVAASFRNGYQNGYCFQFENLEMLDLSIGGARRSYSNRIYSSSSIEEQYFELVSLDCETGYIKSSIWLQPALPRMKTAGMRS